MASNEDGAHYHPISSLNPYQRAWSVKGRVDNVSECRTWSRGSNSGCVFSMDFHDVKPTCGSIRVTFFNDCASEWHPKLTGGGAVLEISRGTLKPSNSKYSKLTHEYELTITSKSQVKILEVQSNQGDGVPTPEQSSEGKQGASSVCTLASVFNAKSGGSSSPVRVQARINFTHNATNPPFYRGCPKPRCMKKLLENGDALSCPACNVTVECFEPRFRTNLKISDATGDFWATAFERASEVCACVCVFGLIDPSSSLSLRAHTHATLLSPFFFCT